ncbi:hypothetical protein PHJA_001997200 [Phtheirospermum japonicum]|uniref:Uncharacterized protein n=1 Tax=Phtheirospermum japonicum TaxID=374723 RepID=A0A830CRN7_9LAMI|nr:hypothetical protein PHJA_001997200 [Phtheirospermum japonicum]
MEVETDAETTSSSSLPGDLITALEQATLMAKQLPITTNPSHLLQIQAALHAAHRHLSIFLHPPPPPPQSAVLPSPQPENSVSSAVGGGDEPMEMGDDEDEQNSRAVEKVEGRLRECSIQNKRLKRQLSPSAAAVAERRRSYENVAVLDSGTADFDPVGTKLRSLDLIYQFHA